MNGPLVVFVFLVLCSWSAVLGVVRVAWAAFPSSHAGWPFTVLLMALAPVAIVGVFLGDTLLRQVYPHIYAGRGDNPSQIAELIGACIVFPSYVPVVLLTRRLERGRIREQRRGAEGE